MNNWNSLADFIYMNGHGYYVWCAYGAFVLGVPKGGGRRRFDDDFWY